MGYSTCILIWSFLLGLELVASVTEFTYPQNGSFSPEDDLLDDKMAYYRERGTGTRPISNSSNPIEIQFGLRLINVQILEKEQTLRMSVWCRIMWYDERLKWEPEKYGGLRYMSVPYTDVWTPDIDLANTAETARDERASLVSVRYNGRVFWTPHRMYTSGCLIDITNYPYDSHTCELWFQSLGISSTMLNVVPYNYSVPFDLETYIESYKSSKEWEITGNSSERFEKPREKGAILMYSRRVALRFKLTLTRRVGFRAYMVMAPCLLLSFMTCMVFGLPPERPDRHMLAMSLFGSFVILLLILIEAAPPSAASVPNLGYYYGCCIGMIILSVFCSAFVIFISRKSDQGKPMPHIIKKVFIDVIGGAMCLNKNTPRGPNPPDNVEANRKIESPAFDENTAAESAEPVKLIPERYPGEHREANAPAMWFNRFDAKLQRVESLLAEPKHRPEVPSMQPQVSNRVRAQWKTLTVVLDRLFIAMFFTLNVVALVLFFPRG